MSDSKVRGIVHFIDTTKQYGSGDFRKRVVVLEQAGDKFTSYIPVEFMYDGCDSVDGMKLGDDVEVTYRLNGRRWQKDSSSEVKYFLNAEALSFQVMGGGGDAQAGGQSAPAASSAPADDIPF